MNIVIPMSGTGSRFANKGYKEIKPLVKVFGKPIIQYIVEKFSDEDDFIFICRKEHLLKTDLDLENYLKSLATNVKVLSVDDHKLGPVHSLLEVKNFIDFESELIVNYCDFDWRWNYQEFKKWLAIEKPDAALCVYSGYHPHYINPASYAHTRNHQHYVLEIKEKQSFTKYREEEPAASGTFYFSSGKILFDACNWLIDKNEKINGEFYVSLLFNYFPLKNMRTLSYFVKYFMQWGTPEDLEDYKFLAKKVPMNFPSYLINCPSITLMAGKGKRMKSVDNVKKPFLTIDNKFLYQICNQNFKTSKKNIYALNGDKDDNYYGNLIDESSKVFVGETNSSVETLLKVLETVDFEEDQEILILPCDASINLNWENFLQDYKKMSNCEAVIFSFSGYYFARWKPDQYGWIKSNIDKTIKSVGYKEGWNADFLNPIVTGYFWFPNIGKLKNKLKKFFEISKEFKNEISIDQFCEFLIKNNNKVYSYEVDDFLCLGTAEEFRAYEYWINANEITKLI